MSSFGGGHIEKRRGRVEYLQHNSSTCALHSSIRFSCTDTVTHPCTRACMVVSSCWLSVHVYTILSIIYQVYSTCRWAGGPRRNRNRFLSKVRYIRINMYASFLLALPKKSFQKKFPTKFPRTCFRSDFSQAAEIALATSDGVKHAVVVSCIIGR